MTEEWLLGPKEQYQINKDRPHDWLDRLLAAQHAKTLEWAKGQGWKTPEEVSKDIGDRVSMAWQQGHDEALMDACIQGQIADARADERRKCGEWLTHHSLVPHKYLGGVIAKLRSGEEPEGWPK